MMRYQKYKSIYNMMSTETILIKREICFKEILIANTTK